MADATPLIDRSLFFGDPDISGAQLSPDGEFIAFLKPWKQMRNLWIKRTDEPFDAARRLTAETRRSVDFFRWTRDGKYILVYKDEGGDENFNLHAVDPRAAGAEGAAPSRNLTGGGKIATIIYALPRNEPDVIYAGLNDRDPAWHDLYRIRISTGERELIRQNNDRIAWWHFDNDGKPRLAVRARPDGTKEMLRVDADGLRVIFVTDPFEGVNFQRFHPDGRRAWLVTDKGEGRKLTELILLDLDTGSEELVERDPENRTDLWGAVFSEASDSLIATVYNREKIAFHWQTPDWRATGDLLAAELPGMTLSLESGTRDDNRWLVRAYADNDPGGTWLLDRAAGKLTPIFRLRESLPRAGLSAQQPLSYKSSDGLDIPAYLTLPVGLGDKNLPLIVLPHGGPWGRDNWGFNSAVQFLANRGYAVLQPNFRGSSGHGKEFINAGNLQWGDKMQDDLTWGVREMISRGIADPKRTGILGISYGGYATLAGVAFTPDLYAAAVAIVAPSNLLTLMASFPPYWESMRTVFYRRMGDPRTEEGRQQLRRQSPLFSADRIKTPLMVVQGANDPRVTIAESDQIVEALHRHRFPVEYLVAPDEGHGFSGELNKLAMFTAIESFLAKHLGGRCQQDVPPDVATRLSVLRVDPASVRHQPQAAASR